MKKVISFVLILLSLGLLYLIFLSPVLRVKSFSVSSDSLTCSSADEIKSAIQVNGINFFTLDRQKLEKKIKDKFFCIGSVNFKKTLPDKVRVELKNRQAVYNLIKWEATSSTESTPSAEFIATSSGFLVDKEGVIFAKANDGIILQPIFFEGDKLIIGQRLAFDLVAKITQVLQRLKSLNIDLTGAKIYSSNLFSLGQKPKVIFILNEMLDHQLASLQLIINKAKIEKLEIELVDLHFDKPVVRYAPKK